MRINWRMVVWVALWWFLVVNGPSILAYFTTTPPCNPLRLETCEP
jgi:hypothetical protein